MNDEPLIRGIRFKLKQGHPIYNDEAEALLAERDRLKRFAEAIQDAPELNPSNYTHDEVCDLNAQVCNAVAALLKESP